MIFFKIILTIAIMALMIYLISHKYNTVMTLFSISFFIMLIYTIYTGNSIMAENTSGNNLIDIFEYIVKEFSNQSVKVGILLMSVIGFVKYMEHIKATNLLVQTVSTPLRKIKNKTIIIFITIFLVTLLKLFIPSHLGVVTLLMTFLFPILINLGIDKVTAASSIVLGGAVDYGLACPVTNYVVSIDGISSHTNILDFFVNYQIPAVFILMLLMSIVYVILNHSTVSSNKDDGNLLVLSSNTNIPKIYAIFPVIPLVLVIIFSKFAISNITISIAAANFIGFVLSFAINLIFSKNRKQTFNETMCFFEGMGNGFLNVVLIVSASLFAYSLTLINGLSELLNVFSNMKFGNFIAPISASLTAFITSFISGSGVAATYSIAPYIPKIAELTRC